MSTRKNRGPVEILFTSSSERGDAGTLLWTLPNLTSVGTLRGSTPPRHGLAHLRHPRGVSRLTDVSSTGGLCSHGTATGSVSHTVISSVNDNTALLSFTLRREQPHVRSFPIERAGAVACSPDGSFVLAASSSSSPSSSKSPGAVIAPSNNQAGISASSSSSSSSQSGKVMLWDAVSGQVVAVFEAHVRPVVYVAFVAGGASMVTAAKDGTVRVWDTAAVVSGTDSGPVMSIAAHSMQIEGCAIAMDGAPCGRSRIITVSSDRECKGWDLDTSECLFRVVLPSALTCVCVDSAWTMAFVGTRDGDIYKLDLAADVAASPSADANPVLQGHEGPVLSITLSNDATTLFSGGVDSSVRVWDAVLCQHVRTLKSHAGPVTCVSTQVVDKSLLDREDRDADKGEWQPVTLQKYAAEGTPGVQTV